MSRQFLITLGAAVVLIGVAVYSTVSINQGHLLTLAGSIDDVRVVALSPEATLVVVDFTATNPSEVGFEMKELSLERMDGDKAVPGALLSKAESARYFEYAKMPHPNESLGIGDRIKGGETVKRVMVARFDSAPDGLALATYRMRFRHIENVDAEISGRKK